MRPRDGQDRRRRDRPVAGTDAIADGQAVVDDDGTVLLYVKVW